MAMLFSSCNKIDYKSFVGTWGVEKIEYYNIDYAGNPIPASMEIYEFDPEDFDNGVHLIFREDRTGEMRDSAIDSLAVYDEDSQTVDHYIYCPDTVVVTKFTYSYDKSDRTLYMNLETMRTFRLQIQEMTADAFTYEDEYRVDYMEKAYMKRVSETPIKSASRKVTKHPFKLGSLIGDR